MAAGVGHGLSVAADVVHAPVPPPEEIGVEPEQRMAAGVPRETSVAVDERHAQPAVVHDLRPAPAYQAVVPTDVMVMTKIHEGLKGELKYLVYLKQQEHSQAVAHLKRQELHWRPSTRRESRPRLEVGRACHREASLASAVSRKGEDQHRKAMDASEHQGQQYWERRRAKRP